MRGRPLTQFDRTGRFGTTSGDSGKNTIICDGDGGVIPQIAPNQDLSCGLGDCIAAHEDHHINDLIRGGGGSVCNGKARGEMVTFSRCGAHRSEIGASGTEIDCLQAKLRGAGCECKKKIKDRIDTMRDYMEENLDNWMARCDLYEAFP